MSMEWNRLVPEVPDGYLFRFFEYLGERPVR